MLSYQHIYHAGCPADVHKHALLAEVLETMVRSPEPLIYLETHAGRGLYDLSSPEARKTGEAKAGILRLLAEKRLKSQETYGKLIAQTRAKYGEYAYPGSPLIAKFMLRKTDRLYLHELHPQEYAALRQVVNGPNITVKKENGYIASMRLTPPANRRGLILIDPSFEIKTEYEQAAYFVLDLHERWPEAVILFWYPLLKNWLFKEMTDYLDKAKLPNYQRHEVQFADPEQTRGMFGSGMIGINLPVSANGLFIGDNITFRHDD